MDADVLEPAVAPPPASAAPDTVTVGCKLPNGLVLHLDTMVDYRIPMPGGGTVIERRSRRLPDTYTLNGSAIDLARIAATGSVSHRIIGGYGITTGIPRDFWERWLAANKNAEYVQKRLVFAEPNEGRAEAAAIEGAKIRTGMEPIDPDEPGRFNPDARKIQRGTMAVS